MSCSNYPCSNLNGLCGPAHKGTLSKLIPELQQGGHLSFVLADSILSELVDLLPPHTTDMTITAGYTTPVGECGSTPRHKHPRSVSEPPFHRVVHILNGLPQLWVWNSPRVFQICRHVAFRSFLRSYDVIIDQCPLARAPGFSRLQGLNIEFEQGFGGKLRWLIRLQTGI